MQPGFQDATPSPPASPAKPAPPCPVRGAMAHRYAIREQMAHDIKALIAEHGDIEPLEERLLLDLGWTELQIRAHGAAAQSRCTELRRRELSDEAA